MYLADVLAEAGALTSIKLTGNEILEQGMTSLAEAMGSYCDALTEVNLSSNKVATDGAVAIATHMAGVPAVRTSRLVVLTLYLTASHHQRSHSWPSLTSPTTPSATKASPRWCTWSTAASVL